ncbi:hypothetical protein BABINDRAFT_164779 [Babjeviella inositovora NRRL Y-12698]|uniref:Uncharacterized protein n=1 Tax=Babjeviella inositovora NRRL Y-12698 TaxID=984486 RepID=A0A1E3QZG1_9ASCO|nr:uncharacterized protein BABINDRAFT_164779 [Babjeviella inositovora NRRL Y-12698]ODQ83069.1 hypothetical protein BABINDRAFT_164779 [Babjeviella inositovora NRRL Y-12698]
MVWPFYKKTEEKTPELSSQLPSDLYAFLENHSLQLANSSESHSKPTIQYDRTNPDEVERVEQLKKFKRLFNATKMAASNCETVSIVANEVRRNNRMSKTGASAIQWTGKCISSQREALMQLGFEDAITMEQAYQISDIVQETFSKHYGKHGNRLSEEDYNPFFAFLNEVKDQRLVVWGVQQ